MTSTGHASLVIDDVDTLIAELEAEYVEIREFTHVAATATNNCTYFDVNHSAAGECCKTF
jgi:hypothetical protein